MALGIFGAALVFGDSMITPAISVLSAVEGLKVVEPGFEDWVVPIKSQAVITSAFSVAAQASGTRGAGFGHDRLRAAPNRTVIVGSRIEV